MSAVTPATIPAARRKLIDRIAANVARRRVGSIRAESFVQDYFRGVAEEDLAQYSPEQLATSALGHLRRGAVRKRSQALVRVFNPDRARDGWSSTHTVVEVIVDDMPFLVDSVTMVLTHAALTIHLMVHPVLIADRDAQGRLRSISAHNEAGKRESWQQIQIDRIDDAKARDLEAKICKTLDDVRAAVNDWSEMRQRAAALAQEIERTRLPVAKDDATEAAEFLRWMADNHFTFLGYREYRLKRGPSEDALIANTETGLGILRAKRGRDPEPTRLRGELREHARAKELLTITKANALSTVHRAIHLDYVGIRTFDSAGRVVGERRFLGLFTSSVYNRSPSEIPLLRQKIERVIEHFGLDSASHDGKAVVHVLDTYPRDELFQASVADLIRIVRGVVNLYERQRVRVFLRRDGFGRFYSALIYVPRDRYNTQVRQKMENVIREELHATEIDSQVQLSESALARVHVIARVVRSHERRVDVEDLERRIAETVHTWEDKLREALIASKGEFDGRALGDRYSTLFPAAYEEDVAPEAAIADIDQLELLQKDADRIGIRLVAGRGDAVHLRLFRTGSPIALSQALPVLENMGFLVLSERPYRIAKDEQRAIWLQDFEMRPRDGGAISADEIAPRFADAFTAVWSNRAENDGFNRLIVSAGLDWRQAMVLRAYCKHILQAGIAFSQSYMEQVFASNSSVATLLVSIFETQFDPSQRPKEREKTLAKLRRGLDRKLDAVKSLDEDRILRRFANLIDVTLRTNYFQKTSEGTPKAYLSFKIDPRRVDDMPQPRPAFEIFVYSPRVEGVHLRMGQVARGGLRWSDRREDFRTEVLGLMKAQNVKNTLIVPVGAKGGFVPKCLPVGATREDVQREGVECYRTFIRGLLDVTDNIVGGKVVQPPDVVRRDSDDAYLVVAADKGTATFSDIANGIAAEYGFWLGDAFASGGSAGYDHKKMGITARGAWECVKRHFRELGIDTQSQNFTAVGIGDMSGDVFGNGMLQSPHIKLVAAFNHQHIFVDPDPDPAASFAERRRLFALPRSTWEDYNRKLLSKGGAIYSRSSKELRLSTQAREMLGLDSETITPIELIRCILRMPVDLLWNGGIGTYVKATQETHQQVGDRANDSLRVNGAELRCRVVGEGGNLGFTQRARIEYALNGGRINTDFVDNSGGVDCSDHEVNIKILLNNAPPRFALTLSKRNRLLVDMTDEVAALVLRDNYLQSQALSIMEARAKSDLLEHAYTIRDLEVAGQLNRSLEFLPTAEEIDERHKTARGLTRPELAILLAYAKMALYSRLIESDVPEDPYLGHELERYFPPQIEKQCGSFLRSHRLRREIIATATTNSMVNRMGAAFARRAQEDTGANAATVVRAYAIAREAFAMRRTWSDIEKLDNRIQAATQYEMMYETTRLVRFCTYWLIHHHRDALNIDAQVRRLSGGLAELAEHLPQVLSGSDLQIFEQRREHYRSAKVPEPLSTRLASFIALRAAPDIVELAAQTRVRLPTVARVYFGLGTELALDWIRECIESLGVDGHWQAVARTTLRDNIYEMQRSLCLQALHGAQRTVDASKALNAWIERNRRSLDHVKQTVTDMRALPTADFATLSVALQAVRRAAEG